MIDMTRLSWPVVLSSACLVVGLSVGVRQVSGVFLTPVVVDLGMTRQTFGLAVALQNIVWGLSQPVAGMLADRFGAFRIVLIGGFAYAAGLALAANAPSAFWFAIGFSLLCGLGQAGTAYAVILAVVGRSAPEGRRAVAVGLASAAGSVGMFLLVPVGSSLLGSVGWRSALGILAAMVCLISVAAFALRLPVPEMPAPTVAAGPVLRKTLADGAFWRLNLGFAACGFQLAFLATYLPTIVLDGGLSFTTGAAVLPCIGFANIPGTFASSWAGGRFPPPRVLAWMYFARGALMLAFLALPLSSWSAIAFGLAVGLIWSGTVPLTSMLVGDIWGRANLGLLFGLTYVGHQVGAFIGAYSGGYAFDHGGTFEPVWFAAVAVSFVAGALHLTLPMRPSVRPVNPTA